MELKSILDNEKYFFIESSNVFGFKIKPQFFHLDVVKPEPYKITITLYDFNDIKNNEVKKVTNIIYESNQSKQETLKIFSLIEDEIKKSNYEIVKGNSKPYFEFKLFPDLYDIIKNNSNQEIDKELGQAISLFKKTPLKITKFTNITLN